MYILGFICLHLYTGGYTLTVSMVVSFYLWQLWVKMHRFWHIKTSQFFQSFITVASLFVIEISFFVMAVVSIWLKMAILSFMYADTLVFAFISFLGIGFLFSSDFLFHLNLVFLRCCLGNSYQYYLQTREGSKGQPDYSCCLCWRFYL